MLCGVDGFPYTVTKIYTVEKILTESPHKEHML